MTEPITAELTTAHQTTIKNIHHESLAAAANGVCVFDVPDGLLNAWLVTS